MLFSNINLFSVTENIEYIETDGDYILEQTDAMETENLDDNEEQWDAKGTTTLLNLYQENLEKFRNPKVRKKNLWIEIAAVIGKTPDSCDKKFRNLKQTYIRLLKKKNMGTATKIRWPYYDVFNEIYCINGEFQPEIQQKIQENAEESIVKKALMSIKTAVIDEADNVKSSNGSIDEEKKLRKKRLGELKKATLEMRDRQKIVEEKLDRLINVVEESNSIQRERNVLFEQFLEKLNQNR